ncbi:MAG: response regulator [Alphaproteobacteria bacterium]|nr:response regulator [Alphaproteobacteria bacterium]
MINRLRPIEILMVEDNDGDVFLTRRAFEKAKIRNNIVIAQDGEKALSLLRNEDGAEDFILPDIILLDINLPGKDGKQVLAELKQDENLKRIPIVILTSSQADQDIIKSYELHANGYIVKPVSPEKFNEVVLAIEEFWFSVVVLPSDI